MSAWHRNARFALLDEGPPGVGRPAEAQRGSF
ncbi:hypothetical protein QFZ27_001285 [Inquilinus ginsengisoli]